MGKIYDPPKGMILPDIGKYGKIDTYFEDCEKFVEKIKAFAKKQGRQKESGEEVRFPVGDGYARYVVVTLKPVALIHLAVGDAWEYQYVHRLTAADIRQEIAGRKALNKLFSKSKASA